MGHLRNRRIEDLPWEIVALVKTVFTRWVFKLLIWWIFGKLIKGLMKRDGIKVSFFLLIAIFYFILVWKDREILVFGFCILQVFVDTINNYNWLVIDLQVLTSKNPITFKNKTENFDRLQLFTFSAQVSFLTVHILNYRRYKQKFWFFKCEVLSGAESIGVC